MATLEKTGVMPLIRTNVLQISADEDINWINWRSEMDAREINKAIGAHGVWKVRLREAIESGVSDYVPETVAADSACEFGKWMYNIPAAERPVEFWEKVQKVHAQFHQEAGKILKLALEGKRDQALEMMNDLRGEFVTTSIEMTTILSEWKKVSA